MKRYFGIRFFLLAVVFLIAALTSISWKLFSTSLAQSDNQTYILTAPNWGPRQIEAVTEAGGTVTFGHDQSGVGIATSSDPGFLARVLSSNAISGGAVDQVVLWLPPNEQVVENAVTPGDETFINLQWNIRAIEAPAAWAAGFDGSGARVAILDGGIHNTHVDLDNNIDIARSVSFVPGFNYNQDVGTFWHGTHVAGIVAAEDNGRGTIGIAPGATIIGVKVLHNGSGSFASVIAGILYAGTPLSEGGAGADIINMSLGATFARGGGNTGAGLLVAARMRIARLCARSFRCACWRYMKAKSRRKRRCSRIFEASTD
ncbi:MAG: S8 family serine peptidase [Acidobacteria bacterium]|nr:S8 family serine peptidase [Acidobacteriota bacterium]